jgi:hypothetical protein
MVGFRRLKLILSVSRHLTDECISKYLSRVFSFHRLTHVALKPFREVHGKISASPGELDEALQHFAVDVLLARRL